MAAAAGSSILIASRSRSLHQAAPAMAFLKPVSFSIQKRSFPAIRLQPFPMRFRVSCAAKPATVKKVVEIVRKQLAIADDSPVTGESKFSQLGADSLDTVEIVMGIEEAFDVTVQEDSAQNIVTVQDVADLVDELIENKAA